MGGDLDAFQTPVVAFMEGPEMDGLEMLYGGEPENPIEFHVSINLGKEEMSHLISLALANEKLTRGDLSDPIPVMRACKEVAIKILGLQVLENFYNLPTGDELYKVAEHAVESLFGDVDP